MTGAGERLLSPTIPVAYGFDLRCDAAGRRQKLELTWGGDSRFRLARLTSVTCIDDLNLGSAQPAAGFDTLMGRGRGRYNGRPGATIRFRFVDLGHAPSHDSVHVQVRAASGRTLLRVDGKLNDGGHRAR